MHLQLSSDQEFFGETTRRFLEGECPLTAVRALRHDAYGFDRKYWGQGAELGWMSLLVSEDDGGGSISGRGLIDLTLVAYEFGRHSSPGPLVGANVVAAALSRSGSAEQKEVLGSVMAGASIATWAHAEASPNDRLGVVATTAARDGDGFVLNGVKRPVEAGAQADHLLVSATVDGALTQFLVPADAAGLTIRALTSIDVSRRFATVRLDDVRVPASAVVGTVGGAASALAYQQNVAAVLACAESVGAIDVGFEITLDWAFNRYSFGRPLASYQEIKHRFADMKMWQEASHAITDRAADAVQDGDARQVEFVSAAKAYVGDYGTELLQDCVQIHGGIGVTWDHDLHLFLRRAVQNQQLYGSPADHRERITAAVQQRQESAA